VVRFSALSSDFIQDLLVWRSYLERPQSDENKCIFMGTTEEDVALSLNAVIRITSTIIRKEKHSENKLRAR